MNVIRLNAIEIDVHVRLRDSVRPNRRYHAADRPGTRQRERQQSKLV